MYEEKQFKFTCPKCGSNGVVQVREQVTVKQSVDAITVSPNPTLGADPNSKRFDLLTGWSGDSHGKVSHFECACCQFKLRGKPSFSSPEGPAIKSAKQLHDWLNRNGQLT